MPKPKKTINDSLPFNPLILVRITDAKCQEKDPQAQTSAGPTLISLKLVTSFVQEHFFCVGILPHREDHTNPEVQSFTCSLAVYLKHLGVSTEGGL